ncbi:unnamed protein product [Litomosoides sigmodontis]|uniref:Uncharacterized protein n=1 Tax=Litomosoides sigmodontis TaxID=42156 RepID=A0A3P6SIE7_LITSI|nr:unnamed protein product [Litomosoides sigmodontis]
MSDGCAEQLQRCAIITEEYERLIQESKRFAFRKCFPKEMYQKLSIFILQFRCNYELALFENCFEQSIRAVRASFNREILKSDNFIDSAHRYLSALDDCFDSTMQELAQFSHFKPTLIDEDGIYARAIYSVEFADNLWGLPQLIPTHPYLENSATLACLIREKTGRVFGNGINRFIDSADIKLNNVNDSCLLEESEMQCYRQQLSNDRFYLKLLIDREHVIRSCIRSATSNYNKYCFRSIRLQTQCHPTDASRFRACLCSAREEFENRVQASILQCVRQSHTDHLRYERKQLQRQWREQNQQNKQPILNTGTVWNGQCLCACPYTVNSK